MREEDVVCSSTSDRVLEIFRFILFGENIMKNHNRVIPVDLTQISLVSIIKFFQLQKTLTAKRCSSPKV